MEEVSEQDHDLLNTKIPMVDDQSGAWYMYYKQGFVEQGKWKTIFHFKVCMISYIKCEHKH